MFLCTLNLFDILGNIFFVFFVTLESDLTYIFVKRFIVIFFYLACVFWYMQQSMFTVIFVSQCGTCMAGHLKKEVERHRYSLCLCAVLGYRHAFGLLLCGLLGVLCVSNVIKLHDDKGASKQTK